MWSQHDIWKTEDHKPMADITVIRAIFYIDPLFLSYLSGVKAKDFQVSDSSVSPLLIEMNHLRNHSGIIKDRLEAQAKLVKERTNHVQLKLQVKQLKVENDLLQRQIETLNAAKSNLQTNKTLLGKFSLQPVFVNMQQAVNLHGLLWDSKWLFDLSWNRGNLRQMPNRMAPS